MATRYVDFSATNNGDGTTAAQAGAPAGVGAYNTLVGVTVTASDTVWIRRAGSITLAASFTFSVNNVSYIGWPITTDEDYAGRPASGTSNGWDGDSTAAIATINFNNNGASNFNVAITGTNTLIKRLKFNQTSSASTAGQGDFVLSAGTSNYTLKYVIMTSASTSGNQNLLNTQNGATLIASSCTFSSATQSNVVLIVLGSTVQFYDCTLTRTAPVTSGTTATVLLTSANSCEFIRCLFNVTGGTACRCLLVNTNNPTLPHVFVDCTFDNSAGTVASAEAIITVTNILVMFRNCKTKGTGLSITGVAGFGPQHFSEINQTIALATGALLLATVPLFVCDNLTAAFGNTSYDLTIGVGCLVLLNNAKFSFPNAPITCFSAGIPIFPGVFISSYQGIPGNFYFTGYGGTISSTNVTRSGGSALSFKFEYLIGWQSVNDLGLIPGIAPLTLGIPGILDPIVISLASGTRTITVYGYYKNGDTTPTSEEIWMELEYLDLSSPTRTVLTTKARGALTSDTSTWTGEDANITKFKLVISSLSVSSSTYGVVRLSRKMWDPGSYVVFDSAPVVT